MLWIVIGGGAASVAVLLYLSLGQVEDWSRDLTTNHARTTDDAEDTRLRPIQAACTVDEAADAIERAAATIPRWSQAQRTREGDIIRIAFVRTTPLMRFKDDISLEVTPTATGSRITAESQSRVGKGDLGQNPRNLREILCATCRELGEAMGQL